MAKRRNKNQAPGPVTIIRPGDEVTVDESVRHAEPAAPEKPVKPARAAKAAKPNKSARLLKKEAQAKREADGYVEAEAPIDVDTSTKDLSSAQVDAPAVLENFAEVETSPEAEAPTDFEAPPEVESTAEIEAPAEVETPLEVEAAADTQVDDGVHHPLSGDSSDEPSATADVDILEMDMQSARGSDADYAPSAPVVLEVDDASGALAHAIDVDPTTVTSKPKQFESIAILPTDGSSVELGEQGMGDGDSDSGIQRDWTPVGATSERTPVEFDLPEPIEFEPAAIEEPDAKGKKPGRKLKLNKLQKHVRGASGSVAESESEAVVAPAAPRPPRAWRAPAFAKLTEYQELSLAHVPGLPEETDVPGHWRGVGFGLGGRRLVSPFDEVVEIMRMPQITHVPGTQSWMLGVANVRGTLLPVVDLKQFLEGERTVIHEGQRVLVVRQGGGNVAVLIDQLFGQRSFNDSQKADLVEDASRYGHFVKQMYRVGDSDWGVFSMSMLTRTPEFRQAAA